MLSTVGQVLSPVTILFSSVEQACCIQFGKDLVRMIGHLLLGVLQALCKSEEHVCHTSSACVDAAALYAFTRVHAALYNLWQQQWSHLAKEMPWRQKIYAYMLATHRHYANCARTVIREQPPSL